jgi:hypothetical protein
MLSERTVAQTSIPYFPSRSKVKVRNREERTGLPQLNNPGARGTTRHVQVQDAPPIVSDQEEAVEYTERAGGDCEEVHPRRPLPGGCRESSTSAWPPRDREVPGASTGNSSLGNIKTQR